MPKIIYFFKNTSLIIFIIKFQIRNHAKKLVNNEKIEEGEGQIVN